MVGEMAGLEVDLSAVCWVVQMVVVMAVLKVLKLDD